MAVQTPPLLRSQPRVEPDESLVARLLDCDAAALDVLYDRYFSRVYVCLAKRCRDPSEVERAVEKALHRAFSSLEAFHRRDARVSFSAWVLAVVQREVGAG